MRLVHARGFEGIASARQQILPFILLDRFFALEVFPLVDVVLIDDDLIRHVRDTLQNGRCTHLVHVRDGALSILSSFFDGKPVVTADLTAVESGILVVPGNVGRFVLIENDLHRSQALTSARLALQLFHG